MLKIGYEKGKGLGARLKGIVKPIQLQPKMTIVVLGYECTAEEYIK